MHNDRCMFFSKIGACRHGDLCSKLHVRPANSPTVLFPMMYPNPMAVTLLEDPALEVDFDKKYLKKHFEHFYKEIWRTFMEFGRIEELRVVSNLGDHLLGSVYIRFEDPAVASRITTELHSTMLDGILVLPELSPVVNFAEACCKEELESTCPRGKQCNYMHLMKISRKVQEKLQKEQDKFWRKKAKSSRKRSRSASEDAAGRVDVRSLCVICGKKGHVAADCPMK